MSRCLRIPVTLGVLGCAVAIAACGVTSTYSTSGSAGSANNNNAAFVPFARCMRTDGVPNFPDPSGGGGIHLPPGTNPFSPAFKSAQSKCKHLLPGGGPPTGPPSAKAKLQALTISECMRRHGVTGFPDPTDTPPSNPSGYSQILDLGGAVLAVPSTIDTASPAYQAAAKACAFGD
jgi:hypothetical protein